MSEMISIALHDCTPQKDGTCEFYGFPIAVCLAAQNLARKERIAQLEAENARLRSELFEATKYQLKGPIEI